MVDVKWWNSEGKRDVDIEMSDSTFVLPEKFVGHVEENWENAKGNSTYNAGLLNFVGHRDNFAKVHFSDGLDYKTTVSLRSGKNVAPSDEHGVCALGIMNPVLTSDNKLILSRRKLFGDWENGSWELCGGFVESASAQKYSLINEAKKIFLRDHREFGEDSIADIIPIAFYLYPEILEGQFLCVTKVRLSSEEVLSSFSGNNIHDEILCFDFSDDGIRKMKNAEGSWHPPSKTVVSLLHEKIEEVLSLIN